MKKVIPLLFITVTSYLFCVGCSSSKFNHGVPKQYYLQFQGVQTKSQQISLKKDSTRYNPKTLIIYYNQDNGKKNIVEAIKQYGATILYLYNNINGIVISIPESKTQEESIQYFKKLKGVLEITKDYKYKIDQ